MGCENIAGKSLTRWTQVLKLFTLCIMYCVVPKGTHNGNSDRDSKTSG